MSERFIKQVQEIQERQGWNDASLSHLALEFISARGPSFEGAFLVWLTEQAAEENEASGPPRELVDPSRLVIGEEHHANTLYPGSNHSVSECPGQAGGCAFGPPPEQETVVIQTKDLVRDDGGDRWLDYSRCTPTQARRFLANVNPELWRAIDWITKQPVDL